MSSRWSAPFVRYDNFFSNRPDRAPADLLALLTTHPEPLCDSATCAGRECQFKKSRSAWSPVTLLEGATRSNAAVVSVNYFVADLDGLAPGGLSRVLEAVAGYAAVVHTTHSHAPPESGSYRLVLPLSRPVEPAEWPAVRAGVVAALDLPADPATKDLSRLYALPDARAGVAPESLVLEGEAVDVDEALQVAAPAAPGPLAPSAPPAAVDLAAARELLSAARRSKASSSSDRSREQAAVLGRVLDGEPLAAPGERDATLLRACGLLVYWLPAGTPWEVALELLRPSLSKMDVEPEVLDHWVEEARDMHARTAVTRAKRDAKRAEEGADLARLVESISGRSVAAAAASDDLAGWESLLVEVKGGLKGCELNAQLLLSCAPELRGTLRWNEVAKAVEVVGGPLTTSDPASLHTSLAAWLQLHYQFMGGGQLVSSAILQVARESKYDPVAEYLGELAWDGAPRVDSFLEVYFGVEGDPAYVRAVSRRWLISLVARALRPGCKVDTVLILEGAQGVGKSMALEALVGQRHFLDTALELGNKDAMQAVASAWLVELGELASLRKAETDRIKQFITSRVDKFRPPYGHVMEESLRRCVFVGTTNDQDYLRDYTGNRRYWPVRVTKTDVSAVERDRDLVLAEAVAAFRAGERWWLLDDEVVSAARETEERVAVPTTQEAIERWWYGEPPARRPAKFLLLDAAELAIKVGPDRVDRRLSIEIGIALSRMGFVRRGKMRYYEPTLEMLEAPVRTTAARAAGLALVAAVREKRVDK